MSISANGYRLPVEFSAEIPLPTHGKTLEEASSLPDWERELTLAGHRAMERALSTDPPPPRWSLPSSRRSRYAVRVLLVLPPGENPSENQEENPGENPGEDQGKESPRMRCRLQLVSLVFSLLKEFGILPSLDCVDHFETSLWDDFHRGPDRDGREEHGELSLAVARFWDLEDH